MPKDTKDIEVSSAGLGMTLEDLLREGARELIEKAVDGVGGNYCEATKP